MSRKKKSASLRQRVGKVTIYQHHGAWYLYYREAGRAKRLRVSSDLETAQQMAAEANSKLTCGLKSPFSFEPILVADLRGKFLDHHEEIERSSLATVKRYRSATNHLANYAGQTAAHLIHADEFLRYLRRLRVSPNGHQHTAKRPLRDKGIHFILETCATMYKYAAKKHHLPPYTDNPFDEIRIPKSKIQDRQAIEVLDEDSEYQFFEAIERPLLPFFAFLAKTGARSGELRHAMIEDFDLEKGWWHVRNKPALGWWIKTRRERSIPLLPELIEIFRAVVGPRTKGLVFWNQCPNGLPKYARLDYRMLVREAVRKVEKQEVEQKQALTRVQQARVYEKVWREAGIVRQESIRIAMMRATSKISLSHLTCPKSWRHLFACLLQEANVDPLIRQITLGHMPTSPESSALGMTGVYTHTRPELQQKEICRALIARSRVLELVKMRLGIIEA